MLPTTFISLKRIDSTNSWARRNLPLFDVSSLTIILAEEQTGGRGRSSNVWISPPLENLYVSFAFSYPTNPFLLSQIASLALNQSLEAFQVHSRIKWPNDLMTAKGKIAGILVEAVQLEDTQWAIVGIGVNVRMQQPPETIQRPITSVFLETGKEEKPIALLEKLTECFQILLQEDPDNVRARWHEKIAWMVGTTLSLKMDNREQKAKVLEITKEGFLTCQTASGIKTISSAEIF